jgi:uncharacterized protein (TIGR03435 family)
MNAVRRALFVFVVLALLACVASAQTPSTTLPALNRPANALAFEVATIKLTQPNTPYGNGIDVYPGGRVVIHGNSLKGLIAIAFHLSYWQIQGSEDWMAKDLYEIEAKAPEGMQPAGFNLRHTLFEIDDERLRKMLQALLIDRFQLQFHRETKTAKVYLLERSGKPLRLQPVDQESAGADSNWAAFGSIGWAEKWALFDVTMAQLSGFAADHYMHCPVIDRTALNGAFNYKSPHEDAIPGIGEPPDSFVNMIQEIGLKLTPTKGPVETFVIDHAERPSPN